MNVTPFDKYFQDVANGYRMATCGDDAYLLQPGEKTLLCSRYIGPGTVLPGKKPGDYKSEKHRPINKPDRIAEAHDYDYAKAFKLKGRKREMAIRKADEVMLKSLDKIPFFERDIYWWASKAGIQIKNKVEDVLPFFAKIFIGDWFGA